MFPGIYRAESLHLATTRYSDVLRTGICIRDRLWAVAPLRMAGEGWSTLTLLGCHTRGSPFRSKFTWRVESPAGGHTKIPLEGQKHTAGEAELDTGCDPKVAVHQPNCAMSIIWVSLLDDSIPERVFNDTDKTVCEHKLDATVRYPAEGSERAS
jgi:hypothetical protein